MSLYCDEKLILVFVMVILALVAMVGYVNASDDLDIQIITNNQQNDKNNLWNEKKYLQMM